MNHKPSARLGMDYRRSASERGFIMRPDWTRALFNDTAEPNGSELVVAEADEHFSVHEDLAPSSAPHEMLAAAEPSR
jgi:hypothetical protein